MIKMNISTNNQNDNKNSENKASGSISHAAAILVCLSKGIHTVSEIARQCGFGKSTVHRVLKLLEDSDMVMQDPFNRNYYLGSLIARLNSNPLTSHEYLVIFALEEMKRLSKLSEETVTLDIFIGMQMVPLFEIPSLHDLKVTENKRIGGPLHVGASGKVLLSQLGDKQLDLAMDSITLDAMTERTVTDREILLAQIKAIRAQKYAISYGEKNPGVECVSVPVYHYTFPAAVSVIGPEVRLEPNIKTILDETKKSGQKISEKLREFAEKGGE